MPTSRSLTANDAINQFCTLFRRRSAAMAMMTRLLPSTIVMMMIVTATVASVTRRHSSLQFDATMSSLLVDVALIRRSDVIVTSSPANRQRADDSAHSLSLLEFTISTCICRALSDAPSLRQFDL